MRNDLPTKPEKPPKPPRVTKRQKSKVENEPAVGPDVESSSAANSTPVERKISLPPKRPPLPSCSPSSKRSSLSNGHYEIPTDFPKPVSPERIDNLKMIDDEESLKGSRQSLSPPEMEPRDIDNANSTPIQSIPSIEITDESTPKVQADYALNEKPSKQSAPDQPSQVPSKSSPQTSPRSTIKSTASVEKYRSGRYHHRKACPVADGEASESSEYDDSCCMPTSKLSVIIKSVLSDGPHQPAIAPRSFSSPAQAIYESKSKPTPPKIAPKPKSAKPPPRPKPPDLTKRLKRDPRKNIPNNRSADDDGTEDSGDYKDISFKKKEPQFPSPYEELNFMTSSGFSQENLNEDDYHRYEEVGVQSSNVAQPNSERQYEKINVCSAEDVAPTGNISEIDSIYNEQVEVKSDPLAPNTSAQEKEIAETVSAEGESGDTTDTLSVRESLQSEYMTPALSTASIQNQSITSDASDYNDSNEILDTVNLPSVDICGLYTNAEPKKAISQGPFESSNMKEKEELEQPLYYNEAQKLPEIDPSKSAPNETSPEPLTETLKQDKNCKQPLYSNENQPPLENPSIKLDIIKKGPPPPPRPKPPKISKKPFKPPEKLEKPESEAKQTLETLSVNFKDSTVEKSENTSSVAPPILLKTTSTVVAEKTKCDSSIYSTKVLPAKFSAPQIMDGASKSEAQTASEKKYSNVRQEASSSHVSSNISQKVYSSTENKAVKSGSYSLFHTQIDNVSSSLTQESYRKISDQEYVNSSELSQVGVKSSPSQIKNKNLQNELKKKLDDKNLSIQQKFSSNQQSAYSFQQNYSAEKESVTGSYSVMQSEKDYSSTSQCYGSFRRLPDPDTVKITKKAPPARPPPPQPKRPPRKKQRSQTAVVNRQEVIEAREKFQRSRRSQSLTEADLAKRLWMAEKPVRPPIDIKTLYTKVHKESAKCSTIDSVDGPKLKSEALNNESEKVQEQVQDDELAESKMQCRPLPAPPPPPRSKRKSAENTPLTPSFGNGTPNFSQQRAQIEARKLLDSHKNATNKPEIKESSGQPLRERSTSIGSDLSSAYDSLYPRTTSWYDDGDAADESNVSSHVASMDEEPSHVPNSDIENCSNVRKSMSSVLSSRSSSGRKKDEKLDKRKLKLGDKREGNEDIYCYEFQDKSETSDTESIKIRIRIEKKTERGGEEKVVVKRSVPVKEIIRIEGRECHSQPPETNRPSSGISPSDSLSQIPDIDAHEVADIPELLANSLPNNLPSFPSDKCDSKETEIQLSSHKDVPISSASDSWHSALDTSSDSGDEEIDSRYHKDQLYLIAREIMTSEEAYMDVLKLMNVDFREHIQKCNDADGNPVISQSSLDQVLKYLPQLQTLNENFLLHLSKRIRAWGETPRIADIIIKVGPFFKLYSSYVSEFESTSSYFDELCKKNSAFAKALKTFEMTKRCQMLAVKHYMLKPVQRIPQYKLLIEKYLKHVPENTEEHSDAQTALSIVSKVADHINQSIKDVDNFNKMIEIQSSIVGNFELIRPGRMFIKEGSLNKLSRKGEQARWFVLLNDCLLYMTPTPQGNKINYNLPLTGLKVMIPTQEDYQNEFSIITIIRSFSLTASSKEERESWITAINQAISNNSSRRNTFNNVSNYQSGSKSDSEIASCTLGHQAPVWIPDARVSMCQICTESFTVTFRRHHCRACGKVVCKRCSANKAALQYQKFRLARVCDECFNVLDTNMINVGGVSVKKNQLLLETESDVTESESSSSVSSPSVTFERQTRKINPFFLRRKMKGKSALEEVTANDQNSDMSGYLQCKIKRNWKKWWFVIKEKVLYSYLASQDIKALESTPLLGYEVSIVNEKMDGCEDGLAFELSHRGRPAMIFYAENEPLGQKWIKAITDATVLQ